jgi:hypothetical protein
MSIIFPVFFPANFYSSFRALLQGHLLQEPLLSLSGRVEVFLLGVQEHPTPLTKT